MKTKYCSKCSRKLNIEYFSKNSYMKDGFQNWCKACRRQLQTESRDKIRQYQKTYYDKNSDKIKERSRLWSKSNADNRKQYQKLWYRSNIEERRMKDSKNTLLAALFIKHIATSSQ